MIDLASTLLILLVLRDQVTIFSVIVSYENTSVILTERNFVLLLWIL